LKECNPKNVKRVATATTKGKRKRVRQHRRWRDEIEEYLNTMGIVNR
jgi:hypothetical protein